MAELYLCGKSKTANILESLKVLERLWSLGYWGQIWKLLLTLYLNLTKLDGDSEAQTSTRAYVNMY